MYNSSAWKNSSLIPNLDSVASKDSAFKYDVSYTFLK